MTPVASRGQLVRYAFLMYFVVSLVAVPCADWLAELMQAAAGAGDFRDGGIVLESLLDGSIATLFLPLSFGAIVMFPLSIPLRMTWLAAIQNPEWSFRQQLGLGLRRSPTALGASILLATLGTCLAGLLVTGAWLIHAGFDGDVNRQSAALWTSLALVPLLVGAVLLLTAIDLAHAACLKSGIRQSLSGIGPKTRRALPTYALYGLICLVTVTAGAMLEAAPWVLLLCLQLLIFARYIARSFWLKAALLRMTTPANQAM